MYTTVHQQHFFFLKTFFIFAFLLISIPFYALGVTIGDKSLLLFVFNKSLALAIFSCWLNSSLAAQEKTCSTFLPLSAEVSKHLFILCFFAYSMAFSYETSR